MADCADLVTSCRGFRLTPTTLAEDSTYAISLRMPVSRRQRSQRLSTPMRARAATDLLPEAHAHASWQRIGLTVGGFALVYAGSLIAVH